MTHSHPTKGLSHAHPFFVIAGAILGATLVSTAAAAQQACGQRDKFLGVLAQKYGETPVSLGVTTTGRLLEVLTSEKNNTWTIIETTPQGMSCTVRIGEGWRTQERTEQEPQA